MSRLKGRLQLAALSVVCAQPLFWVLVHTLGFAETLRVVALICAGVTVVVGTVLAFVCAVIAVAPED